MASKILIVDSNEAFATMLKEGLEANNRYDAHVVHSSADALQAVVESTFDMVIVDMGLEDIPPHKLVKAIREAKTGMKIMIIPLMGQGVPSDVEALGIQGILTKPFFIGDLPDTVGQALGEPPRKKEEEAPEEEAPPPEEEEEKKKPAEKSKAKKKAEEPPPEEEEAEEEEKGRGEPEPPEGASPEVGRLLKRHADDIGKHLSELNGEVRAEAILVTWGQQLIAFSGRISQERAEDMAFLLAEVSSTSAHIADFLGETEGKFEQNLYEGNDYRFYALSLEEGVMLSIAVSSTITVGMIRYHARHTAEELGNYI